MDLIETLRSGRCRPWPPWIGSTVRRG